MTDPNAPTPPPTGPQAPDPTPPSWNSVGSSAPQSGYGTPLEAPPATGVTATQAVRRGGGPTKWIVAGIVTVVAAAVIGGAVFLANRGTTSTASAGATAGYLPAATLMFAEVRGDLPGDQRQSLAEFLKHFPGFADTSTFDIKYAEMLDRFFGSATKGKVTYSADVKPWWGGQAAFALTSLPSATAAGSPPAVVIVFTVTDQAKAQLFIDKLRAQSPQTTFTSEDYQGTTIWTSTGGKSSSASYALTKDAIILTASAADLKAALDRKAGKGDTLAAAGGFADAMKKVRSDHVMAFYLSSTLMQQIVPRPSGSPAGAASLPAGCPAASSALGFAAIEGELHFEADKAVIETRVTGTTPEMRVTTVHTSTLASRVPKGGLAYIETHDLGKTIKNALAQLRCGAQGASMQRQLSQLQSLLGTAPDEFFSFIDDAAISGGLTGVTPSAELVANVNDEAIANQRMSKLIGQVKAMSPKAVSEATYGGTTVTTVDLSAGSESPGPFPIAFSYAIKDKVLILGYGDSVKTALDLKPEDSIANDQRYRDAVAAAKGDPASAFMYIDVKAVRTLVEPLIKKNLPPNYDTDIKPYVAPLDLIVASGNLEGDDVTSRIVLTVK